MRVEPWLSPKAVLQSSDLDWEGLFALDRIFLGEEVLRWGGRYVSRDEAVASGQEWMQWDENVFTVADEVSHPAFRINHSCDGNTWMEGLNVLSACTEIEAGSEITIDYALFLHDEAYVATWLCRCRSPRCRGRITGRDWAIPEIIDKYVGHFSPLLNKRVTER